MRHLVLSGMGKLLGPDAETLLFAAARDDPLAAPLDLEPRSPVIAARTPEGLKAVASVPVWP